MAVEVPRAAFAACIYVLEGLEGNQGKAGLIAGLFGYFLSSFPAGPAERLWHETISRLALEGAAVGRGIPPDEGSC